jgi:5-methylthioribose kinase
MALAELATEPDVLTYLRAVPELVERLGDGLDGECRLLHLGALNRIFELRKLGRGVAIVKQALPYLQVEDEEWPLERRHALYERRALELQASACPGLVPEVYYSDTAHGILVLEHVGDMPPLAGHGRTSGAPLPDSGIVAQFCAQTLFRTSDYFLSTDQKMTLAEFFAPNLELAGFLHRKLFIEPFLAESLQDIHAAPQVLERVTQLGYVFMTHQEALYHGRLTARHILTDGAQVRIISPTYACLGPSGFDPGILCAHMLRLGLADDGSRLGETVSWIREYWLEFERQYLELWRLENHGDATPAELYHEESAAEVLESYRTARLRAMLQEAVGFAGCELLACAVQDAHSAEAPLLAHMKQLGERCILHSDGVATAADVVDLLVEDAGASRG